jgi:tRNA (adenine-N(1)-)-methyltransferase non-catalytic subunit
LNLRIDTLSQLLNLASIRPGGRYLVVEDTGGFVVGAMLDRMGGQGRIMQITDNDSPPAWPVLEGMNFPKHITDDVVAFLNWYEAEEDYVPVQVDNAAADDAPEGTRNLAKEAAKARRRDAQLAALNRTREELHRGEWDALVVACNMSPPSVISRLTPYLAGSAGIVVYGQFQSVLNETLQGMRERPEYLAPNLTESFTRRYQVSWGRLEVSCGGNADPGRRQSPSPGTSRSHAPTDDDEFDGWLSITRDESVSRCDDYLVVSPDPIRR